MKYGLSWSRRARATHRYLLIWLSSDVWGVAIRHGPMTAPLCAGGWPWLCHNHMALLGLPEHLSNKGSPASLWFTLHWLQTLRWFTSRTTNAYKSQFVFSQIWGFYVFFFPIGKTQCLEYGEFSRNFYESWINLTQQWENQSWNKMEVVSNFCPLTRLGEMRQVT